MVPGKVYLDKVKVYLDQAKCIETMHQAKVCVEPNCLQSEEHENWQWSEFECNLIASTS